MDEKTMHEWLEAIREDWESIEKIPDELKNQEFYEEAIKWNPMIFSYIPDEFISPKVCFRCAYYTEDFEDCPIPVEKLTVKVALAAMLRAVELDYNGDFLHKWIPEPLADIVEYLYETEVLPENLADDYDGSDLDLED